ncbi:IS982 family transposase, partial [Enterococcus faecium]
KSCSKLELRVWNSFCLQSETVETVFSSLEKLGCQNFNSRSVKGLESRFESILLAYSVLLSRAQRRFEGTLRYSLGY